MGNKLATSSASADFYLHDVDGVCFERSIGDGRVLKSLRCAHEDGVVVVKVHVKRPPHMDLAPYAEGLEYMRKALSGVEASHVLPFPRWIEKDRAGYLIRQYLAHNLEERIGTRPFLRTIEKQWLAFQLLHALVQAHSNRVFHGDIKCENVMVTSWNWLYLTDFSCLWKPALISEDEVSHDFSFFFDTSGTRTCCIAPERICKGEVDKTARLTASYDIFSAGCVIAQLFLDGNPLFTFSQLLSYRKGELDLSKVLARVSDKPARDLIASMCALNPLDRRSASQYVEEWSTTFGFPACFHELHNYVDRLLQMTPDQRVLAVDGDLGALVVLSCGEKIDLELERKSVELDSQLRFARAVSHTVKQASVLPSGISMLYAKEYAEFKKRVYSREGRGDATSLRMLEEFCSALEMEERPVTNSGEEDEFDVQEEELRRVVTPQRMHILMPFRSEHCSSPHAAEVEDSERGSGGSGHGELSATGQRNARGVLLIVLSVLCSCARDIAAPSVASDLLDLFLRMSAYLDDHSRLQRLVPYTLNMVNHASALVRSVAINTLTSVLSSIHTFSSTDSHVFPEYILPSLAFYPNDPEEIVRQSFAANVSELALTAKRFLEHAQSFKVDITPGRPDDIPALAKGPGEGFDEELHELHGWFKLAVGGIINDQSTSVRCAFLPGSGEVARFFGREVTAEFLLPRIISLLNVRDWELRCAFFDPMVSIGSLVGRDCLQSFIFPCIVQGLRDEEDFVVAKAADCLAALCGLRMFRPALLFEVILRMAPLLCHPNVWIRNAVVSVLVDVGRCLEKCDIYSILLPAIRPFLVDDIAEVSDVAVLGAMKPPLEKAVFDHGVRVCNALSYAPPASSEATNEEDKRIEKRLKELLRPHGLIAGTLLEKHRKLVVDPSDTFTHRLAHELKETGITGELQELLLLMTPVLLTSGRMQNPQENDAPRAIFPDVGDLDQYMALSANIPVHSVTLPYASDSARRSTYEDSEEMNWQVLASARCHEKPTAFTQSSDEAKAGAGVGGGGHSEVKHCHGDVHPVAEIDSVSASLLPPPLPDLGRLEKVSPGAPLVATYETLRHWRPSGILMATLHEHTQAICEIAVSDDNRFFVSCSDDGTVKLWDCLRLEKNVTNRSRVTHQHGGKVKCVTVLEQSHSIASGSNNNTVHVVRAEYSPVKKDVNTYQPFVEVVPPIDAGSKVMAIDHFNTHSQSLVVFATSSGEIQAWDLRANELAWAMRNEARIGVPQCMTLDRHHNWVAVGTNRGFYASWDARFLLPLNQWRHPTHTDMGIVNMCVCENRNRTMDANSDAAVWATAGDNQVYLWDLGTGACRKLVRVLEDAIKPIPQVEPRVDEPEVRDLLNVDSSFGARRIAASSNGVDVGRETYPHGIRALLMPRHCSYLLTAGCERSIRLWDVMAPPYEGSTRSMTVCGLDAAGQCSRPTLFSSEVHEAVQIYQAELPPDLDLRADFAGPSEDTHKRLTPFPSPLHRDVVTDLAVLQQPTHAIVSGSRDGVIKVWK